MVTWLADPSNHLRGAGCPVCGQNAATGKLCKGRAQFIEEATKKWGPGTYDYSLVDYRSNKTDVVIICPKQGHGQFEQGPTNHLKGHGCPRCANVAPVTREEFIARSEAQHGAGRYDYSLVVCTGSAAKVIIICPKSGHGKFRQGMNQHWAGCGCPRCNESHGEHVIHRVLGDVLPSTGVNYVHQHRIQECRHKHTLPFDFALMESGAAVGLIEYHGQQHYTPRQFFGMSSERAARAFVGVQQRDAIKVQYAAANGIPLLIIPYWDFDKIGALVTGFLLQLRIGTQF